MPKILHLGWLARFSAPAPAEGFAGVPGDVWADGRTQADLARALERARFDFLLVDGGEHDPFPLLSVLASATEHLGVVATASTGFYPPYILARALSTLDHLTRGRVGWNVTASSADLAAQLGGVRAGIDDAGSRPDDGLGTEAERYERADEFVDVARRLWSSWEPDALLMNHETGHYIDHTKVRRIDHVGKHFTVRGPLNTMPSPQGHPVVGHFGTAERAVRFAAEHAELVVAPAGSVESMRRFRAGFHERLTAAGRDTSECVILFGIDPVLGETDAEALEKSAVVDDEDDGILRLVGSVDTVADRMGEVMDAVGGDGFLVVGSQTTTRIAEVVDGLVPALQRRGLTRTAYEHTTFRANLLGA